MKIRTAGRRRTQDVGPAAPTRDATGGELRSLTGLRIVAALWVVAFHFHFTDLPGVAHATGVLGPLVTQGALGVDLFFVLSGFVIAHTYLDRLGARPRPRAAAAFVWARAARMWPAYVVVFHLFGIWLVARAVLGSGDDIAFQAVQPRLGWGEWLQQLFLVQMWDEPFLDGSSWVGPTWSVSAEWLAYLLFPVTALVFFRLRRLPTVVLAAGALALTAPPVASFLLVGSPYYPFSWAVRVLCGFSAGVLTLLVVRRLRAGGRAWVPRVASYTACAAVVGVVAALVAGGADGGAPTGLVIALFPVLVGSLALADRGPARWLATGPMVHGGRISYALYLVHIPVLEVLWLALRFGAQGRLGGWLAPDAPSTYVIAAAVLLTTLPLAHLLFVLVERPARRWMRRPSSGRSGTDVPVDVPAQVTAEPMTSVLPGPVVVRPVDTTAARLDPPTMRLPGPTLPGQTLSGHTLPAPRTEDEWSPADRVRAARAAGHGDDRHGDGLAGNLLAAARLRAGHAVSVGVVDDGSGRTPDDLADRLVRLRPETPPSGVGTRATDAGPSEPPAPDDDVPADRRAGRIGSRTGAERCGRGRHAHRAHGSAATPIVVAAAAAARRDRRPSHALPHRGGR